MMPCSIYRWPLVVVCVTSLVGYARADSSTRQPAGHAAGPRQTISQRSQPVTQQRRRADNRPVQPVADKQQANTKTLPLKPPQTVNSTTTATRPMLPTKSLTSVFGSLGIVLGLFFLFVWFSKRNSSTSSAALPKEAVEVLGRVPSGSRQHMELVRLGNKLVLVSVTPNATTTLAEVNEPDEVERLTALCRDGRGGRVSSAMQALSRAST